MNEFIKILEKHEDTYFYGEEKNLAPFISGEFLEKFKETLFAGDTHCKYNFNGKEYSELTITYKKNKYTTKLYKIESLEIQINKKGKKYDRVELKFYNGLDIDKIKKIFIGNVEIKIIDKEELYNMIKQGEIELGNDEEDFEEVKEYLNDNKNEIYDDYITAVNKYNNKNNYRINVDKKFGAETAFYFDLYGKLTGIGFFSDYGYDLYASVNFREKTQQEHKKEDKKQSKQASEEEVVVDELAPASEKSINDLINLYN